MRRSIGCWTALVLLCAGAQAQDVFIRRGRLVDPRAREVRPANLLILDGRIAGHPEEAPADFDGPLLDAAGKWIIPGLHDMHVHAMTNPLPGGKREFLGTPAVARRMLYVGVTGFLDLLNAESYIFGLRDRQRREATATEADIFAAGPSLNAGGGDWLRIAPTRLIDTPKDARREIAQLAPKRPDVIKIIHGSGRGPNIDEPTLEAAVRAAAEHGIPSVVHVNTWDDAARAARAGATAITHVPGDEPVREDVVRLIRERDIFYIPTLATGCGALRIASGAESIDSPLFAALASERVMASFRSMNRDSGFVRYQREECPGRLAAVGRLAEAGVRLVTGSDSGNAGTLHALSLHHELALFVEAGVSPWQALAASTTVAGELLGRSWGLSPGDEGSVVLLDASPIDDILNTRKISAVVHHGVPVDRQALAAKMFPSILSREFLSVVPAHLRARHYLLLLGVVLAIVLAIVLAGRAAVRVLKREFSGRRQVAR